MARLAFIGDVHGCWSEEDNRWFDQAGYDRVVFVGDLAGLRFRKTLEICRSIAQMKAPALLVPGNHDATHAPQLVAEALGFPRLGGPFRYLPGSRLAQLSEALGAHEVVGYSHHVVGGVSLIAGRPHSMGGPHIAFVDQLRRDWAVDSLKSSADRLCSLVDSATDRLLFVAHCGPTGLGDQAQDIWGRDFGPGEGDWGDPDLRVAIDYAKGGGKQVLAVVAGHMHRRIRGGGQRAWRVERDGTLYLNAAVVPRIRKGLRHHLAVTVEGPAIRVEERWV